MSQAKILNRENNFSLVDTAFVVKKLAFIKLSTSTFGIQYVSPIYIEDFSRDHQNLANSDTQNTIAGRLPTCIFHPLSLSDRGQHV